MDQRMFLIIFITVLGGGEGVLGVNQRLQAFENAIEEARPYLRDRRLRRDDAYDIERRMLSSAFKKAMGQDILKLDVELEQSLRASAGQHGRDENSALMQNVNDDIAEDFDENGNGNANSNQKYSTSNKGDGTDVSVDEFENYEQSNNDEDASYSKIDNDGLNDGCQQSAYYADNHEMKNFLQPSLSNRNFEAEKPSFNYMGESLKCGAVPIDENPDEDDDNTNFNKAFTLGKRNKEALQQSLDSEESKCFSGTGHYEEQKFYEPFDGENLNIWEGDTVNKDSNDMCCDFQHEKDNSKKNINDNEETNNFWHKYDTTSDGRSVEKFEIPKLDDERQIDFKLKSDLLRARPSADMASNAMNDAGKNYYSTAGNADSEYETDEYNIHDYGAHIYDKYDDIQNMSWTQWLVNHPNIYLYATKNFQVVSNILPKDANRTAIEELVRNSAKLLQAQKDALTQQSDQNDVELNAINKVTSSFDRIGAAAKEYALSDRSLLNTIMKAHGPATTADNNWDQSRSAVQRKLNNFISFNGSDKSDRMDRQPNQSGQSDQRDQLDQLGQSDQADEFQMSSMEQDNQIKNSDENESNYNQNNQVDLMPKEKRNPVWNNWPITNPATFNFGMKYKKDRAPPTLMILDPLVLQPLAHENSIYFEENSAAVQSADENEQEHPTNDQIDLNKNDLSHEADYKLSRLEQEQNDAMHGRNDKFWSTFNSRQSEKNAENIWQKAEKT